MSSPPAEFAPVAPPVDGLSLAFTAARRRRNSKAAVTAFGGAVAVASVLSMLAPAGQTLVEQPAPPAHRSLPVAPAPASHPADVTSPLRRTPAVQPAAAGASASHAGTAAVARPRGHGVGTSPAASRGDGCTGARWLACSGFHTKAAGGGTHAEVTACSTALVVSLGYSLPVEVPGPTTGQREIVVGTGTCDS
jgi:hypothetical protein